MRRRISSKSGFPEHSQLDDIAWLTKVAPVAVGLGLLGFAYTVWEDLPLHWVFISLSAFHGAALFGVGYFRAWRRSGFLRLLSVGLLIFSASVLREYFFSPEYLGNAALQFFCIFVITFFSLIYVSRLSLRKRYSA
jgi:hypothetical protein